MRESFVLNETSVWITADDRERDKDKDKDKDKNKRYIEIAKEEIVRRRRELERFVRWHPYFLVALEPYQYQRDEAEKEEVPEIVERMIAAAEKVGIGPMSAVAGTLAEFACEAMLNAGAIYAMVDNGGDIALINDREVLVGIYAGESQFSNKIALRIKPRASPCPSLIGICTSSGTVGHSISFGTADAATVISTSASLADAAATALCNTIIDAQSIPEAFRVIAHVEGIEGALVIYRDMLATWGKVPEIVEIETKSTTILTE
ncbi:MAG: UPF0280 family protein [Methanophagales archaeon]|nr:UPF0280 family protein [Methanophagales archaeon]